MPNPQPEDELTARARAWLAEDPDPQTREELTALLDLEPEARDEELADRFSGTLQFGTAGLRGELGAGPMRMNRAVVIRAAAGLAAHLAKQRGHPGSGDSGGPDGAAGSGGSGGSGDGAGSGADGPGLVVVGYDARHKSAEFARDTAAVMVGAGLRAALLPGPLPTPVLAFAVRELGAVAGVTVTASHNPPQDNGYKVFLGDGSQITAPVDAEIAAEIAAVGALDSVPRPESGWQTLGPEVLDAYLERARGVLTDGSPREVRVVHTALHGVGGATLVAAFTGAGFPAPTTVPEQAEPDPDFPTVAFPNPEEPGAMDLAFAMAQEVQPDLVIANDPDADRCAVAVPAPETSSGWRMLHGDEVGALLAVHLVHKRAVGTFATSIVSSTLLSKIAAAAEQPYAETLTGFKWLSRVADLRYAYEEALGYCVDPEGVRDKDGITAALLVAELAAELKASGRTLGDLLDDLAVRHGLHATDQLSVRVKELSAIEDALRRLRDDPPGALGGLPVAAAEDLGEGAGDGAGGAGTALPPTEGLRYRLAGSEQLGVAGARVVVRPSGTEPKLKCYLEVVLPVADGTVLPQARARAEAALAALKTDFSVAAGI